MGQMTDSHPQERELRTAKLLLSLALVAVAIAAAAGLILIATDPASGSTLEGALGLTAAIAGLSTAGFAIAAAIYAQVKDLWRYAPTWFRVAAWAVIIVGLVITVWNWIGQAT